MIADDTAEHHTDDKHKSLTLIKTTYKEIKKLDGLMLD